MRFVIRHLDGRFLVILTWMTDLVTNRDVIEGYWSDRLEDATVFTISHHDLSHLLKCFPDTYPYFFMGRKG